MRGSPRRPTAMSAWSSYDPTIDFVGLARSLGVEAERARTVHDATDLIAQALEGAAAMLIDVALDRAFKPM